MEDDWIYTGLGWEVRYRKKIKGWMKVRKKKENYEGEGKYRTVRLVNEGK